VNTKPGVLPSALRVFDISLGQMLWSRRSIFLALLVGAPMAMALAIRMVAATRGLPVINGAGLNGPALFGILIWLLFVRFVVPVLGVFYGTSLIADEVDDKTITYLFTRPVPRSAVLLGKYLSYLACVVLLVLPSVVVVYFLIVPIGGHIGESFPSLAKDLGMLVAGLATYGAVFAFVGARLKKPLVAGLVFTFGWETTVLLIPGYLKWLSVAYYLQGLVPHAMPADSSISALLSVFQELPSVWVSVISLTGITVLGLWLAGLTVEKREYVLEQ
jgi:ABC-type transport system involved in multi-copper enzyme maturation permease subunit